ncbi:hypothetical protein D3C81_1812080 [compost metagenome]
MIVQPGFEIRRVQAQVAACLAKQGEGVAAQLLACRAGFHGRMCAEEEGCRLQVAGVFARRRWRVVDGKTPRRAEFDSGQCAGVIVVLLRGVAHGGLSGAVAHHFDVGDAGLEEFLAGHPEA